MFRGTHFIISTMQARTTPIFNVFGMTGPTTNRESNPQTLLVGAQPRSPRGHCMYKTYLLTRRTFEKHVFLSCSSTNPEWITMQEHEIKERKDFLKLQRFSRRRYSNTISGQGRTKYTMRNHICPEVSIPLHKYKYKHEGDIS